MSTLYTLFLLAHQDLVRRPDRCERALRVFFPLQSSDYLDPLKAGEPVPVRLGPQEDLAAITCSLQAQGFKVAVRLLEPVQA
jgi:hypothetical protein